MTTKTKSELATIAFAALPALLEPLDGGTFAGITTLEDGTHCAVVLLSVAPKDERYTYAKAKAYAESFGGQHPPKAVWSLLYVTCRGLIPKRWYWADELDGSSYAWGCLFFDSGHIFYEDRNSEGGAVAVRLIPITA